MKKTIIFDFGSRNSRVGFSNDENPCSIFPSVVGNPRHPFHLIFSVPVRDLYIGDDAISRRGVLKLKYPINHGIVNNWDDMEYLINHAYYNELHCLPEEQPIVLTEPPLNSKNSREKLTEILFETFEIPSMYLNTTSFFSLYATNKSTGVVVDIGETVSYISLLYNGYLLQNESTSNRICGWELTMYLKRILDSRGLYISSTNCSLDDFYYVKETMCYVAQNESDLKKYPANNSYEQLDGTLINFGHELVECAEPLFQPTLLGMDICGIHQTTFNSIMACDKSIRNELFNNIVICGGSTMFPGFETRFEKEINNYPLNQNQVHVEAPINRNNLSWKGASKFSTTSIFEEKSLTKNEYEEYGEEYIHSKCF
ncbi:actin [Entamoeba marina]